MALYETVFIARQDITSAQVEALTTAFSDIVGANEGTVVKTEQWGLRTLTYRMNKNRKGHYVLFQFDAPHAAIAEMERNMRINEDVLRYLTLKVEAHDPEPSAMMQNRDRGSRDYENSRPPSRRREYGEDENEFGTPAAASEEISA